MAASTDLVVALAAEVGPRTWTGKLKIDREVTFRTSASKTSNAGAEAADSVGIASVAVVASAAVIASVVEVASSAVIDLGVVPLAEGAALVDSEVAAGVDGKNLGLGFASNFSYNQTNSVNALKQTYEKIINSDGYRQYRHGPGSNIRIRSDCR